MGTILDDLVAKGLPPDQAEMYAALAEQQQGAIGYSAVTQELFPGGLPWGQATTSTSVFGQLVAGAGQAIGATLAGAPPRTTSTPGSGLGAVGDLFGDLGDRTKGIYVDPQTGNIAYEEGVSVDVSGDAMNGVFFDPTSNAPGSFKWLRRAQKWSDEKVSQWRKKLHDLGYNVAEKGKFDELLRAELQKYYRLYYYNGKKEVPLDSSMGGRPQAKDVMDPIEVDQAIRTAFVQATGQEPGDKVLEPFRREWMRTMSRALARGATPQHTELKAAEQFAESFTKDPVIKEFSRRREEVEENTRLADSFLSLGELGMGLGI